MENGRHVGLRPRCGMASLNRVGVRISPLTNRRNKLGSIKEAFDDASLSVWRLIAEILGKLSYNIRILLRRIETKFLTPYSESRLAFIPADSWNLNRSVVKLLIYGLSTMRKKGIGYPAYFEKDGFEKWKAILKEMEEGFEEYLKLENGEYKYNSKEEKKAQNKVDKALKLLREHFYDLWD